MHRIARPLLLASGLFAGLGTMAFGGAASADTVVCPTYPAITCAGPATSAGSGLVTQPATGDGSATAATASAGTAQTAAASSLAFTGTDVAATATGGGAVIAAGAVLVGLSRRRRA